MQMTRELKKRFTGIDDRIEKLEKRKPVQKTNGEEIDYSKTEVEERIEQVEAALQIPGDEGHISGWRYQVEETLKKLEDRLLKVELRGAWTPDEAKTLDARVKTLWGRPSAETFKVFIEALDGRLQKIEQTPDTSKTILEFDDRLAELEKKKLPTPVWMKGIEERVHDLEVKPVAGSLSNTLQEINLETEGNTREMKALRSLVHKTIWIVSAILAVMTLAQFLTNVLP